MNPAILNRLGYSEEELIGPSPAKVFGEEFVHGTIVDTLLRQGVVANVATTFRTSAGYRVPISLSGSLLEDKGGSFRVWSA